MKLRSGGRLRRARNRRAGDQSKKRLIPFLGLLCFLCAACETRESLTRRRIRDVERGLIKAVYLKGLKPEKTSLNERMQFYKVPGLSLAVMDQFRVEWAKSYGVKDVQTLEAVTLDTVFQAGALSQPVAAAAALRLVDKGTIDLDADVNDSLRHWQVELTPAARGKAVTLRGLLTHSAGFLACADPGARQDKPGLLLHSPVPEEGRKTTLPVWIEYEPGSQVLVTEAGYMVLQRLLEDLDGRPIASLLKEDVLDPADMTSSTFEKPLPQRFLPSAALGHLRNGQVLEGKWFNYDELAAKGLWSTPSDLAAFALEIVAEAMGKTPKILSSPLARAMLTPWIGSRGLGFAVDGPADSSHFYLQGKTEGFSCLLVYYPSRGQGAAIMSNSENGGLLIEEILLGLSEVYEWPDYKPQERPLFRLDPSIYQQYVGRYEITPDYALDVAHEDYYLVIRPTGQAPTKFYVENQSTFFSMDPFIRIQFRKDEKGTVKGLLLWQQGFEQTGKKID